MSSTPDTTTDKAARKSVTQHRKCPPFDSARFDRDLAIASATQWALAIGVGLTVFLSSILAVGSPLGQFAPFIVFTGVWLVMSMMNAKAWRTLHTVTALIEHDPVAAETHLAQVMRVPLLSRPVRLLLYHRLALLRFRQGGFGEAAAICNAVLGRRLPRPANAVRPHLLLMYVDSSLQIGDLRGAHWGLSELRRDRIGFIEQLQCLTLQTRYELAAGFHDLALSNLPYKLQLAEMMPAAQCGMLHVLFAAAADRVRQPGIAQWLRQRADLLISPQDVSSLEQTVRGWHASNLPPLHNF